MCVHNITHLNLWKNNTSSSFTTVIFRSTAGTTVCVLTTTTVLGNFYDLGFSTLSYESVRILEYGPVSTTTVQYIYGCRNDSTFFNVRAWTFLVLLYVRVLVLVAGTRCMFPLG